MTPVQTRALLLVQFAAATGLVAAGVAVVIVWMLLLLLALQHALAPWTNAGIVLFGLGFIGFAAVFGIPGVLWSQALAGRFSSRWTRLAKIPYRIGICVLALGAVLAVAVTGLGMFSKG